MRIINVETERGIILKGAMWGDASMETVVIMISGICSNVFQNELLPVTGELLSKNGIAYIAGHTMDAFSFISYSNAKTKKQTTTGVVTDDFNTAYEDTESYVKYAKNLGFKKIILAGHSLGSNKIINYLGNTKDEYVDNFIISAPFELSYYWNVVIPCETKEKYLSTAQKFVGENRENDILPFLFEGFSPMTAKTLLAFYNAQNLKNIPVLSNDGETKSLNSIKCTGLFLIGEKDSMAGDNARDFMKKINSYTQNPDKNKIVVVENASHIFYNKHNEFAEAVLSYVKDNSGSL